MSKYLNELCLILVAMFWGLGFPATQIGLDSYGVIQFLAIRFWVAGLCLTLIFFKSFIKIDKENIKFGVILGVILFSAYYVQTLGLTFTTASKNAFITATNVVFVPLLGLIFYKRKFDIYNILGSIFTFIGIGFISYQKDLSINIGDFLTLICAVLFALHMIYISEFIKKGADTTQITIVQMYTVAILATVIVLVTGKSFAPHDSGENFMISVICILYSGILATAVAFFLQIRVQKNLSESKTVIILSMEAVFGALFSIIILNETLSLTTVLGCVIILGAVLFTELKPNVFGFSRYKTDI